MQPCDCLQRKGSGFAEVSQNYLRFSFFPCRYGMLLGAVLILGLGLPSRPDTSVMSWARKQARRELADDLADD